MLDNGIVRVSTSPLSSPIVVVRERDQSIRLCIDFRKLNDLTVKYSFHFPRIDDCLDAIHGTVQ